MQVAGAKRGKTPASKSRLVLVLLLIGQYSGVRFVSQSQSAAMQNQSNHEITFDTRLKTADRLYAIHKEGRNKQTRRLIMVTYLGTFDTLLF